ncbi:reactive mitochondrial oxygen species modulator 1-domain-containing protein [Trametes gibbosa]|nr:reactive mitochondrial oxygen species modulator 1-domain-containing protein [Trametes gibbosa]KAI0828248.1 reactive mitochondrial oxygen species modulator 1-domain-containing protein [Trametes gibbosa]
MPPVPQHGQPAGLTVWQKSTRMGAAMGAGVGLTMGFLFGTFSILRGGAGPRGVLPTLSQYMLGSAATFSFFLAIGSVIRNDGMLPPHIEAARIQLASPVMMSRAEGLSNMRLQWALEKQRRSSS